ncbi:tRNA (adenine(22)-N(1))-methyltransferase (EC 2.1.1.217) [Oscillospiraceae bacterium]|nr:tRNA (adenine(22)-N(1))-methyltransferase (EC 2.1.1.217) [Oscillospiraceae bacterium]
MKLPISKRLLCCASMVQSGSRVADIGTDHGYLGIYLLQSGAARHVIACDLRKDPLENARRNAKLFGVDGEMEFRLSDGLEKILPDEVDTVVMAGMGGDLIQKILSQCPWRKREGLQFILQPQSAGNVLRRWLCEDGFEIQREEPVQDGHFLYTVMELRQGEPSPLTPGTEYASPALLASKSPLVGTYLARVENALQETVRGLTNAEKQRPERLSYFRQALLEIQEMRKNYAEHP